MVDIVYAATVLGDLSQMKALAAKGERVGKKPWFVHSACTNGHLPILRYLVEECGAGIDVTTGPNEDTVLHLGSEKGHVDIVEYLLDRMGVDCNITNRVGARPLHVAAANGHVEIVDLLMRHRAEVDAVNKIGDAAVHYAAEKGHLDVLTLLVERYSANVHLSNSENYQPLHMAASWKGQLATVQYLVEQCGADITARTENGLTPIDLAKNWEFTDIVQYLHGADAMQGMNILIKPATKVDPTKVDP